MIEKQKRLNEVYDHLRKFYGIHTQIDFAESLGKSRNAISLALNGNESYLSNKLFEGICKCWPGVFNLDYLLTGEGQLLTLEEDVKSERALQPATPSPAPQPVIPDYVQHLCDEAARIATRSEILERSLSNAVAESRDLKDQLADSLNEVQSLKSHLSESLTENSTLRSQLSEAVASVNSMRSQVSQLLSLLRTDSIQSSYMRPMVANDDGPSVPSPDVQK